MEWISRFVIALSVEFSATCKFLIDAFLVFIYIGWQYSRMGLQIVRYIWEAVVREILCFLYVKHLKCFPIVMYFFFMLLVCCLKFILLSNVMPKYLASFVQAICLFPIVTFGEFVVILWWNMNLHISGFDLRRHLLNHVSLFLNLNCGWSVVYHLHIKLNVYHSGTIRNTKYLLLFGKMGQYLFYKV